MTTFLTTKSDYRPGDDSDADQSSDESDGSFLEALCAEVDPKPKGEMKQVKAKSQRSVSGTRFKRDDSKNDGMLSSTLYYSSVVDKAYLNSEEFMISAVVKLRNGSNSPIMISSTITFDMLCILIAKKIDPDYLPGLLRLQYRLENERLKDGFMSLHTRDELKFFIE